MKTIRVELSRGEFFRAVEMKYYYVRLTKDLMVKNGDIILLENTEYKGDDSLTCVLCREVVDWDCVDFMDVNKGTYMVVIENKNYLAKMPEIG